jgi:glycosyltransferase involved in cell wall biosynthesis
LWLVGDEEGSRDPLSKDTITKIKSNEKILRWGHQHDIRPFLSAAYALVFPSYREGFPNVPMQAGAMGCPLILSDIKGCNEIVEHDKNGLLIKPKDVQSIVSAMTYLRRNPKLCEQFAEESQELIADKFKQDVIWQLLLTEYNDFLELQTDALQKKMA